MTAFKNVSLQNLLADLSDWSGHFNGNSFDKSRWRRDNGRAAVAHIQEIVKELAERYKKDPQAVNKNPTAKKVIAVLAAVKDVNDAREVAMAIKHLGVIAKESAPAPANPFAPNGPKRRGR